MPPALLCPLNMRVPLLFNRLDTFPATAQLLLPQAHAVVATADRQNVASHAPAASPHNDFKLEHLALPVARVGLVGACCACPDADGVILRGGCNVRFAERCRRPSDIPDPVRVAGERADVVVRVGGCVVRPQLDLAIGAASDEPAQRRLRLAGKSGARELAGGEGGAPGDGIDAHTVGGEDGVLERVVLEAEHADAAVGAGGGQVAAGLWRRPGDQVDRGGVQGELVDALPLVLRLLAPDEDAAVVGGGCEDGAVFGVGPRNAPDGAFMAVVTMLEVCLAMLSRAIGRSLAL